MRHVTKHVVRQLSAVCVLLTLLGGINTSAVNAQNTAMQEEETGMTFKKLSPNMMVEDITATVGFYRDVLGFQLVMAVLEESHEIVNAIPEDRAAVYALMKNGSVELMFQSRKSLTEDVPALKDTAGLGGSFTLYIEVDDIAGLYAKVKNQTTLVKELQTAWYGMQEFYIQDCNGYILAFAEAKN